MLLSVDNLSKTYKTRKRGFFGRSEAAVVRAVDDVSFDIRRGECLGLVGESGCGKTTVSKILMRAITPDSGSVIFNDGNEVIDVLSVEGDDCRNCAPRSRWCSRIRSPRCRRA